MARLTDHPRTGEPGGDTVTTGGVGCGHPAGVRRILLAAAGLGGLAGGLLYSAFVVARPLGSRLDPARAFVSELGVPGQPASGLFRMSDLLAGVGVLLLAAGLVHHLRGDRRDVIGAVLLAAFGAASIADAIYPMPCTPSTDGACRQQVDSLSLSVQLHHPHTLAGVVELAGTVLAMWLLSRSPTIRRWSSRLPSASVTAGVLVALLAIVMAVLELVGGWSGIPERIEIVITSVWVGTLGWLLLRDALRPAPGAAKLDEDRLR